MAPTLDVLVLFLSESHQLVSRVTLIFPSLKGDLFCIFFGPVELLRAF